MGALNLPPSGMVYLDTPSVIYSVEKHTDYWPLLRPLWAASRTGQIEIVGSELLMLETLVGPLKHKDAELVSAYEQLFTSTEMRLLPITMDILKGAARLRAETKLKTPDAIHVATALAAGCAQFITNDADLKRVSQLPVVILKEVAAA